MSTMRKIARAIARAADPMGAEMSDEIGRLRAENARLVKLCNHGLDEMERLTVERDRARAIAVALEQELAALTEATRAVLAVPSEATFSDLARAADAIHSSIDGREANE